MTQWMRPWIKLAACYFTEGCDRDSSMHQRLHYNGPLTKCVDFIQFYRRQLIYAARLRCPIPQEMSQPLCVVLPYACSLGIDRTWFS